MTGDDFDGAGRDAERASQKSLKLFVGRAFDGRGGQSHAQRAVVLARKSVSRRARHDPHAEGERTVGLCVAKHEFEAGGREAEGKPKRVGDSEVSGLESQERSGDGCLEEPENNEGDDGRDVKDAERRNHASQGNEQRVGHPHEKTHNAVRVRADASPGKDDADENQQRVNVEQTVEEPADDGDNGYLLFRESLRVGEHSASRSQKALGQKQREPAAEDDEQNRDERRTGLTSGSVSRRTKITGRLKGFRSA